jgi:hypothetical protein
LKELENMPSTWSCLQLEREDTKSRSPFKLLIDSSSVFRARMFPSVSGTDPDNWFASKFRVCKLDKFARLVGTGPVSWLVPRCIKRGLE